MSNHDKDSKLVIGALIGGVVGIGALSLFLATRGSKRSSMNTIGQAIVRMGEIFENHGIEEPSSVRNMEKKIHKHEETVEQVLDWIAAGMHLWKKFKD